MFTLRDNKQLLLADSVEKVGFEFHGRKVRA